MTLTGLLENDPVSSKTVYTTLTKAYLEEFPSHADGRQNLSV